MYGEAMKITYKILLLTLLSIVSVWVVGYLASFESQKLLQQISSINAQEINNIEQTFHTKFFLIVGTGTLILLLAGILLSLWVSKKFNKVLELAENLKKEIGGPKIEVGGSDEISQLSRLIINSTKAFDNVSTELEETWENLENSNFRHKKLQERFDLAVRGASDGLWDWDIKTNKVWYSNRFKELLGYNNEVDFPHKFKSWKNTIHPEDRSLAIETIQAHLEEQAPYDIDYRCKTKNGEYRWFRVRGCALRDELGKAFRMAGSIQDVTDKKESFIDLENARERAEEATKAKSNFLANMSHELRTPMNSIMGFTQRLIKKLGDTLSERDLDALKTVDRNAKHLLNLINDILDLSKIEAGKITLEKGEFDLVNVTQGVVTALSPLIESKGLEINFAALEPKINMSADRTKITQIITNLLSNAIKYTDNGWIDVSLEVRESNSLAKDIYISVKDSGVGIKGNSLDSLFSKFTQLACDEEKRKGGTGLGLAITKEYVEMHGGVIEVKSVWQEGSEFTVIIPTNIEDKAETNFKKQKKVEDQEELNLKILCIDDDPCAHALLKAIFEKEGYTVILAENHDEGIAAIEESKPDLICLDICMPGKSGYDVLESIDNMEGVSHIPIIVISAITPLGLRPERKEVRYLSKPIKRDTILKEVRNALAYDIETVLVVEDCDDTAALLIDYISDFNIQVSRSPSGEDALQTLKDNTFSAIVLDLMMPDMDGFSFLKEFDKYPESKKPPVYILTGRELHGEQAEFLRYSSEAIVTKGKDSTTRLIDVMLRCQRMKQNEISYQTKEKIQNA